jgi:DNA polymerase-3 subunit gamma/tau
LNILDTEYYFRLTAQALDGDASSMLLLFNEVLTRGFDARNFINGYAAHLRDLMVCKDPGTLSLLEVGAGFREKYQTQSAQVTLPFLYEGLEICNQADIQFRTSRNQRLTIELALVKLSNLSGVQKKKPVAEEKKHLTQETAARVNETASGDPAPDTGISKVKSAEPRTTEKESTGNGNGSARIVRKSSISIKDSLRGDADEQREPEISGPAGSETVGSGSSERPGPEEILRAWDDFARSVEKTQPRLFNTLKSCKPRVENDGSLLVPLNTEAQQDSFLKVRGKIQDFIADATGYRPPGIRTIVEEPEENGKKIYTDQDKLEFLIKKNPDLGEMKSRFTLDFDQ